MKIFDQKCYLSLLILITKVTFPIDKPFLQKHQKTTLVRLSVRVLRDEKNVILISIQMCESNGASNRNLMSLTKDFPNGLLKKQPMKHGWGRASHNIDVNLTVPLSSDGLLRSEDVQLGEQVMVSGYPYGEIFSDTVKVTGGMVSAIKGMGDDSGQFQIDAAVQPGSSGGPIYDQNGNIVGVVVAQLNKMKLAKNIGSIPENVNFGIKASTVRQFLTSAGLPTKWSSQPKKLSSQDLAKIAKNQTLMVVCHR